MRLPRTQRINRETGELVERSTYLAQGSADSDCRTQRWDSFREDYRFTGKEDDIEVGLTYFGERYYAPALGRWTTADPLALHGLGADLNLYAYVHAQYLSATDALGLTDGADGGQVEPATGFREPLENIATSGDPNAPQGVTVTVAPEGRAFDRSAQATQPPLYVQRYQRT
jgi:RHS repeat-associated protein